MVPTLALLPTQRPFSRLSPQTLVHTQRGGWDLGLEFDLGLVSSPYAIAPTLLNVDDTQVLYHTDLEGPLKPNPNPNFKRNRSEKHQGQSEAVSTNVE